MSTCTFPKGLSIVNTKQVVDTDGCNISSHVHLNLKLPEFLQEYNNTNYGHESLVPWSSCLGGYLSVPDDYPLVLGCEEHVSSLGIFVA